MGLGYGCDRRAGNSAGEVGRPVTQQAHNDLDPLLEHVHAFLERRKGMPKARCSCAFQPAPTPNTSRPPLRVSTAAAMRASKDGCRKVIGHTRAEPQPRRFRGGKRQRHPGLERVTVAVHQRHEVVRAPERFEAQLFHPGHNLSPDVPRQPLLTFEHHTELHMCPPVYYLFA